MLIYNYSGDLDVDIDININYGKNFGKIVVVVVE